MKSIDVAAGTIEYRDEGTSDGPPVVLLHGLLMNDTLWNDTLPLLPNGFRYLLPVLPLGGHRIPMRPDADLSMAGIVGIVADFIDALDLSAVTLVVADWGGPLFLTDVGRDKRVGRLVICPCEAFDNFPPGIPGRLAVVAARNDLSLRMSLRMLQVGWLRRQRPVFGMMAKRPVSQQLVDAWLAHALRDNRIRGDLAKYCRTPLDGDNLVRSTNRLAEFDRPALILWSHNPLMPATHAQRLGALLPNAQLRFVDDAYVLVMLDQPEHVATQIKTFLTR
ncbi:alpha/beta fold hydrolase [Mycobacterium sp. THU-M104]|uniref:alpha/beta fold hydrolase n=1 Tax=Mycobacterium sp. THU-M104 TaxID=3410515 RepID=UPI003B9941FC